VNELEQLDQELVSLAEAQMQNPRASPPLPASFSIEAVYDEKASKAAGKSVYRDQERILIRIGTHDTAEREVTAEDRRTYAAQYVAWKKGQTQESVEGFPLAQWAMIPGKAVVKQFGDYGIRSVEQLAAATDSTVQTIGPYLNLRQKARDWVASAQGQAPLAKLREENVELRNRLSAMEKMLATQSGEIAAARAQGGALAPAAAPDPKLAALEAQVAALVASMQKPPETDAPKRKGGWPKGKSRKPKAPEPETSG